MFDQIHITGDRPSTAKVQTQLVLKLHDHKLFQFLPRRLFYVETNLTWEIIDDLSDSEIISANDSEYFSQIIFNIKKNGKTRICIDCRTYIVT